MCTKAPDHSLACVTAPKEHERDGLGTRGWLRSPALRGVKDFSARRRLHPGTDAALQRDLAVPRDRRQKQHAKLIEYMASGAEGDHIDGFDDHARTPSNRQWRRDLQSGEQHCFVQALRLGARCSVWIRMQPAFTDEEACACHKELFEMMAPDSGSSLESAFQPPPRRGGGGVLLDQSGEHSLQPLLTDDPRHTYCLVPDGGVGCCPTRQCP